MLYNLLERMLNQDNYGAKEDFQSKLDIFFALGRITEDDYKKLTDMLDAKE